MFSQSMNLQGKDWMLSNDDARESLILLGNLYSHSKWKKILGKQVSQGLKDLTKIDEILISKIMDSDVCFVIFFVTSAIFIVFDLG